MVKRTNSNIAFIDFLFCLLLVFISMFLMALLLINPPEDESDVTRNVSHVITIRWNPETTHDVDLWMTDGNEVVGFRNRQGSNFYLERDDLGSDPVSRALGYRLNEESINILDATEGTYTANVHLFSVKSGEMPVRVTWILQRVQPYRRTVDRGEVVLETRGDERTLLTFSFDEDGNVFNRNYNNSPFILRNLSNRDRLVP